MNSRLAAPLVLLFFMTLASATAVAQVNPVFNVSDGQLTELMDGEIIVETERTENMNMGEVIAIIDAPAEELALVVSDIESQVEWFPDTEESTVLSRTDTTAHVRTRSNMPWPLADRHFELTGEYYEREFDGAQCHVFTFDYVEDSGNMDDIYGWWVICPLDGAADRSVVTHVLYADLGMWLPNPVVRWATRRLLPGIVEGLAEYHGEQY